MADAVLDASAILAVIFDEPGREKAEQYLPDAKVSTVNIAEVAARLLSVGMPEPTVQTILDTLQLSIQPFDYRHALATANLRQPTKAAGLSLGDRACLALAGRHGLPALTSDGVWQDIAQSINVEVIVIR